jgi:RNase P/RNase MRP subunit POP5
MKSANKIGLWLLDYDSQRNIGILRCSHRTKEKIITSLTLIKEINRERIIISPVKTAGSIKAIKRIAAEITN